MADEVEPLEPDALEELAALEDLDAPADALEFPNRLVAELNAAEAFGVDVDRADELDVEVEAVDEVLLLVAVELEAESRPYPLRLPLKFGVIRET